MNSHHVFDDKSSYSESKNSYNAIHRFVLPSYGPTTYEEETKNGIRSSLIQVECNEWECFSNM